MPTEIPSYRVAIAYSVKVEQVTINPNVVSMEQSDIKQFIINAAFN